MGQGDGLRGHPLAGPALVTRAAIVAVGTRDRRAMSAVDTPRTRRTYERPRGSPENPEVVYLPLVEDDGVMILAGPGLTERPPPPYLTCDNGSHQLSCGIESLFLPQDEVRDCLKPWPTTT